jgi:hypothetical protein
MSILNQLAILATSYSYSTEEAGWIYPPETSELYGSLEFANNSTSSSHIQYAESEDWAVGTGPFAIEWSQFMQQDDFYPRVFSLGTFNTTASIAVSIESGILYFWLNGNALFGYELTSVFNNWRHIAITRDSSSVLRLYYEGDKVAELNNITTNITDTARPLLIGNETIGDTTAQFKGYLTGFRWAKGEALYTGETLTVPTGPLLTTSGTKLLLNSISDETFLDDDSASERVPTSSDGIQWTNYSPY